MPPAGGLGSCSRDLGSRVRDSAGARGYGTASHVGDRAVVQQRGETVETRWVQAGSRRIG